MLKFGLGTAAVLAFSAAAMAVGENVHRPARLFVAGDYPDKGCSVTVADLDTIIARFNAGGGVVPVKTEHLDSPLDPLGDVVALYRQGDELYGMLCFSSGVNAHIEARGVQDLSIALVRESEADGGGFRLRETSLVFKGRVAGAGFLDQAAINSKLAEFSARGQLTPAMRPHAERLLSVPQLLQFSDGSPVDVASDVLALLASMPVVMPRSPAAAVSFGAPNRGPAISEATRSMAKGLGLAPDRLHGELQKGVAA
jgi:hypothetical protein